MNLAVRSYLLAALGACTPGSDPPVGADGADVDGAPNDGTTAGDAMAGPGDPDAPWPSGADAMTTPPLGACSPVFDGDVLADYHVTISAVEYAALWDEFVNWEERDEADLDPTPWHPIAFRWQGGQQVDAMIRLKGESSWRHAVAYDDPPKMQFVISFNEVDSEARFMGLRKIDLDMPRNDRSFLRQRLAVQVLRELGIYAQCASSARLFINGAYYGLYAALERQDKEFIQRYWPDEDEGVLWDAARRPKVNEEDADDDRIDALWAVDSAAELAAIADLPASLASWAGEALVNDEDGYHGARFHNYMVYDHPSRGFVWISHDLDATWDYGYRDRSPIFRRRDRTPEKHYLLVMHDPYWLDQYLDTLHDQLAMLDVDLLQDRVDEWAAQIAEAAEADPNRPFSYAQHLERVARLRSSIAERAEYLQDWFDCRAGGGADEDGDGYDFCDDCDDDDHRVHPGAGEACNHLDDDCDGYRDEGC